MTKKQTSWDDESNEVQSNWVKFNVSHETDPANCDKVMGTLVSKRQIKSNIQGKEGELVWVYELKADSGLFHELDDKKKLVEAPILIGEGEVWSIGGKPGIDSQMRNIKIGQKVGFKFLDERPAKTKGFNPAKNIKVYAPKDEAGQPQMDTAWLEANKDPNEEYNKY